MNLIEKILSWLLHHANRGTKMDAFYAIKDRILKKYGKQIGYDIQHIEGKKCRSCGGKGYHPRYSNRPPYNVYDWADCWHCSGGWYRWPQWICLAKIQFGKYIFHKPLKREYRIENPFVKDEMGWEVAADDVIIGYIDHSQTRYSELALLVIFMIYDFKLFKRRIKLNLSHYGGGYYYNWKSPYRFINNVIWFLRRPGRVFTERIIRAKGEVIEPEYIRVDDAPCEIDLPF